MPQVVDKKAVGDANRDIRGMMKQVNALEAIVGQQKAAIAELLGRVERLDKGKLDSSGRSVKDYHIDWGVRHDQVKATRIPILDSEGRFEATTVEKALAEVRGAAVSVEVQRGICFPVFDADTDLYVCDGVSFAIIPSDFDGFVISNICAGVAVKGVLGTTTIQVRRRRNNVESEVLSSLISIGDAYYSENGVINSLNSTLATGDKLLVDIQSIHSNQSPKGLAVTVVIK